MPKPGDDFSVVIYTLKTLPPEERRNQVPWEWRQLLDEAAAGWDPGQPGENGSDLLMRVSTFYCKKKLRSKFPDGHGEWLRNLHFVHLELPLEKTVRELQAEGLTMQKVLNSLVPPTPKQGKEKKAHFKSKVEMIGDEGSEEDPSDEDSDSCEGKDVVADPEAVQDCEGSNASSQGNESPEKASSAECTSTANADEVEDTPSPAPTPSDRSADGVVSAGSGDQPAHDSCASEAPSAGRSCSSLPNICQDDSGSVRSPRCRPSHSEVFPLFLLQGLSSTSLVASKASVPEAKPSEKSIASVEEPKPAPAPAPPVTLPRIPALRLDQIDGKDVLCAPKSKEVFPSHRNKGIFFRSNPHPKKHVRQHGQTARLSSGRDYIQRGSVNSREGRHTSRKSSFKGRKPTMASCSTDGEREDDEMPCWLSDSLKQLKLKHTSGHYQALQSARERSFRPRRSFHGLQPALSAPVSARPCEQMEPLLSSRGIEMKVFERKMPSHRYSPQLLAAVANKVPDVCYVDDLEPPEQKNVRELHVVGCRVRSFSEDFFACSGMKEARKIVISENCALKSLPDSLGKAKQLRRLWLSSNGLMSLPETIGALQSLKVLVASWNRLHSFPAEVCSIVTLERLDLSCNLLIQSVPEEIENLVNLQSLNLRGNGLRRLPGAIGKLEWLQHLDVSDNSLRELPDTISLLGKLETLNASDNRLLALPDTIVQLTEKLKVLSLAKNRIALLPEELGEMKALVEISLSHNELEKIPDSICELENLEKLRLDACGLEELPRCFGNLSKLIGLDLSNNQLKALPPSFRLLHRLEHCSVFGNELNTVSKVLLKRKFPLSTF